MYQCTSVELSSEEEEKKVIASNFDPLSLVLNKKLCAKWYEPLITSKVGLREEHTRDIHLHMIFTM